MSAIQRQIYGKKRAKSNFRKGKAKTKMLVQRSLRALKHGRYTMRHRIYMQWLSTVPTTASEVQQRVQALFDERLTPLNEKVCGPLPSKNSDTLTPLPFVFILGNHSSGKSRSLYYSISIRVALFSSLLCSG